MRLLDLYCGAGMAAYGYRQAGFDVIRGIDINRQKHYPYDFRQDDALEVLASDEPEEFDVIHASPPCQLHTQAQHLREAQGKDSRYFDLLTPTIELLREKWSHKVWVVENVPGAPGMDAAAIECGSAYGLGVRRHRLFLSNLLLFSSGCDHERQGRPWGVYHRLGDSIPDGGRTAETIEQAREVMGVDRPIPFSALKEGFPPHYTRHVGEQIASVL